MISSIACRSESLYAEASNSRTIGIKGRGGIDGISVPTVMRPLACLPEELSSLCSTGHCSQCRIGPSSACPPVQAEPAGEMMPSSPYPERRRPQRERQIEPLVSASQDALLGEPTTPEAKTAHGVHRLSGSPSRSATCEPMCEPRAEQSIVEPMAEPVTESGNALFWLAEREELQAQIRTFQSLLDEKNRQLAKIRDFQSTFQNADTSIMQAELSSSRSLLKDLELQLKIKHEKNAQQDLTIQCLEEKCRNLSTIIHETEVTMTSQANVSTIQASAVDQEELIRVAAAAQHTELAANLEKAKLRVLVLEEEVAHKQKEYESQVAGLREKLARLEKAHKEKMSSLQTSHDAEKVALLEKAKRELEEVKYSREEEVEKHQVEQKQWQSRMELLETVVRNTLLELEEQRATSARLKQELSKEYQRAQQASSKLQASEQRTEEQVTVRIKQQLEEMSQEFERTFHEKVKALTLELHEKQAHIDEKAAQASAREVQIESLACSIQILETSLREKEAEIATLREEVESKSFSWLQEALGSTVQFIGPFSSLALPLQVDRQTQRQREEGLLKSEQIQILEREKVGIQVELVNARRSLQEKDGELLHVRELMEEKSTQLQGLKHQHAELENMVKKLKLSNKSEQTMAELQEKNQQALDAKDARINCLVAMIAELQKRAGCDDCRSPVHKSGPIGLIGNSEPVERGLTGSHSSPALHLRQGERSELRLHTSERVFEAMLSQTRSER